MEAGSKREKKQSYCRKRLLQADSFKKIDDEWEMAQGVKKTGYCKQTVSREMIMKERWLPKA